MNAIDRNIIGLLGPRGLRTQEQAATIVEFAVVLPILFLFLFGTIEFGRLMMVEQTLTNAAREGARLAVLEGATASQVVARVNNYLNVSGISGQTVTLNPSDPASVSVDQPVTVTVAVPYSSIAWLPGSFAGLSDLTLQTSSVMRKEGW